MVNADLEKILINLAFSQGRIWADLQGPARTVVDAAGRFPTPSALFFASFEPAVQLFSRAALPETEAVLSFGDQRDHAPRGDDRDCGAGGGDCDHDGVSRRAAPKNPRA